MAHARLSCATKPLTETCSHGSHILDPPVTQLCCLVIKLPKQLVPHVEPQFIGGILLQSAPDLDLNLLREELLLCTLSSHLALNTLGRGRGRLSGCCKTTGLPIWSVLIRIPSHLRKPPSLSLTSWNLLLQRTCTTSSSAEAIRRPRSSHHTLSQKMVSHCGRRFRPESTVLSLTVFVPCLFWASLPRLASRSFCVPPTKLRNRAKP